jgi:hypothetical protein
MIGGAPGPSLTNAGEMVILFFWDGTSDLIRDVDLMIAGNAPTGPNTVGARAPVDGPDADSTPSSYAADGMTIGDMAADTAGSETYARVAFESGAELQDGSGNGLTGDDETSEDIGTTWAIGATGTPGTVPVSLQ